MLRTASYCCRRSTKMDKFVGYSFDKGFIVFDNTDEHLAKHKCLLNDWVYIGFERRFIQHLVDYLIARLRLN